MSAKIHVLIVQLCRINVTSALPLGCDTSYSYPQMNKSTHELSIFKRMMILHPAQRRRREMTDDSTNCTPTQHESVQNIVVSHYHLHHARNFLNKQTTVLIH